tara:strand:+ start:891 stop:1298 length:408 start_codon:yes stop_codon:yes gene_type:complete
MYHLNIKAAAALALTAGAMVTAPVAAGTSSTGVFGALKLGLWEVRERGDSRAQRICVRSERDLVQLRHRGMSCRRVAADERGPNVTIQYSCGGAGYGRTMIRRETPVLVQLRSDGIDRGAPFSFEGEARRIGECN